MKVQPQEYTVMREWFAHVSERIFPPKLLAEAEPTARLDQMAERSPAKARQGLSMGINDLIDLTNRLPNEEVLALDEVLSEKRLPTLTDMRMRFSKVNSRVLRRGYIKDDVEYYAIRNAADGADPKDPLWSLLAAYEQSATR